MYGTSKLAAGAWSLADGRVRLMGSSSFLRSAVGDCDTVSPVARLGHGRGLGPSGPRRCDDVSGAGDAARVDEADDVWVIDRADELHLLNEAFDLDRRRVAGDAVRGQALESDHLPRAELLGAIDGGEPAMADHVEDFVAVVDYRALSETRRQIDRSCCPGGFGGNGGFGGLISNAQLALDPGEENREVDGLGHVVVGAAVQGLDDVFALGLRRGHDDRKPSLGVVLADLLQALDARHAGHHHVEEDQVDTPGRDALQGARPVFGDRCVISLSGESTREHVSIVLVVVDNQDPTLLLRFVAAHSLAAQVPVPTVARDRRPSGGSEARMYQHCPSAASMDYASLASGPVRLCAAR